jgi:hypothetical protein
MLLNTSSLRYKLARLMPTWLISICHARVGNNTTSHAIVHFTTKAERRFDRMSRRMK